LLWSEQAGTLCADRKALRARRIDADVRGPRGRSAGIGREQPSAYRIRAALPRRPGPAWHRGLQQAQAGARRRRASRGPSPCHPSRNGRPIGRRRARRWHEVTAPPKPRAAATRPRTVVADGRPVGTGRCASLAASSCVGLAEGVGDARQRRL
jgi:hypothetical protein